MIKRFFKYSLVGVSTFLLDLLLLYIFASILHINYLLSVFLGFFIAVSINYLLSRKSAFVGTKRGLVDGYSYFLLIMGSGVVIMLTLMYVLVDVVGLDLFMSRILVAGVVGIFNFIVNDKFNFKM